MASYAPYVKRSSVACMFLVVCFLLGLFVPAHGCNDLDESGCNEEEEISDSHMLLLQTALVLESRKVGSNGMLNETQMDVLSTQAEPDSCHLFTTLGLMSNYEMFRAVGAVPPRGACAYYGTPASFHPPNKGTPAKLEFLQEEHEEHTFLSDALSLSPLAYFLIGFAVLYVFIIYVLIQEIRPTGNSKSSNFRGVPYRAELESWKQGYFSWLFISWASPWVRRWGNEADSSQTRIKVDQLGEPGDPDDESSITTRRLEEIWKQDIEQRGMQECNLYKVIVTFCTMRKLVLITALEFVSSMLQFLGPVLALEYTLNYVVWIHLQRQVDPNAVTADTLLLPVIYAVAYWTACPLISAVFNSLGFMVSARMNLQMISGMKGALYRKSQRLPASVPDFTLVSAKQQKMMDEGQEHNVYMQKYSIVQLANGDIGGHLTGMQLALCKVVTLVPTVIGLLVMCAMRIGWACLIALLTTLMMAAISMILIRRTLIKMRLAQMMSSQRLTTLQESLYGIRIIKAYGWERPMQQKIQETRGREITQMTGLFLLQGISTLFGMFTPNLIIIGSLSGYCALYGNPGASDIFVILQVLNAFKAGLESLLACLPALVAVGPSIERLDMFLKLPDAEEAIHCEPVDKAAVAGSWCTVWPRDTQGSVRVQGSFSWHPNGKPSLKHLDVHIKQGEKVAIVGEVGSGKSTLLTAFLGELVPVGDGRVEKPEKIGYHSQIPFISEGTLKANVLNWHSFDEERYNAVIEASALRPDLEILPGGDDVPIGSRGIALSGGQRARVSLARAAYATGTGAILMDDPFASVDAPTGQHIFENLLKGKLLEDKTVIVATQPDQRIMSYDTVILMVKGEVFAQGNPEDVVKLPEYISLLNKHQSTEVAGDSKKTSTAETSSAGKVVSINPASQELREEEHEGRADWSTVDYFFKMGLYANLGGCLLCYGIQVLFGLMSSITLAMWSTSLSYDTQRSPSVYLGGFIFWWACSSVTYCGSWLFGTIFTLRISKRLHDTLLNRIMHAPIDRFFDKTPVGRIMNRMSGELASVDFAMYMKVVGTMTGSMCFILPLCYIHFVCPIFLTVASIPLYIILLYLVRLYWNCMVPLRYLCAINNSIATNYFVEAEWSHVHARAYRIGDAFAHHQMLTTDNCINAEMASACIRRWVLNRFMVLYSFFLPTIVVVGFLMPDIMPVGACSLCIVNVLGVCYGIEGYLDTLTSMQMELVTMNRLHEYSELVQEGDHLCDHDQELRNHEVNLSRADLGSLKSVIDPSDGLMKIYRVIEAGNNTDKAALTELLLIQLPGKSVFLPAPGKKLSDLEPNTEDLKECTDDHLIVGVGGVRGDIERMAKNLCFGITENVWVTIHSKWMEGGAKVVVEDLVAGYADIPVDVIKGISFTIERKQKAAIVGPTGCGKSSTILCLLRMLEPRGGSIEINGKDTQKIGLQTLRNCLGLVPQDSLMFSGSIRMNLDVFEQYPDDSLWDVLKMVHMDEWVSECEGQLHFGVRADGTNLSQGQRQLICIARMLLRQPGLLLLDEATSAIDPKTQETVQDAIMKGFPESTLIAIAHRLETVLDFDVAVVMERGLIVEFGNVSQLANLKGGHFARMLAAKTA